MGQHDDSEETICAIATPSGVGSVGVIRVSGREALPLVQKIFQGARPIVSFKSHTVHWGTITDPETGKPIDEALILVMHKPRSYTGEDVVEIQSHGNPHLLQRILSGLTTVGARLASPGEFTRRAFLSGRIDLSQAEAVMDLITAQGRCAEEMALEHLQGDLSRTLQALRERLISLLSRIEATIDFTEQGIETVPRETLLSSIEECRTSVMRLLAEYESGRQIRDGSVVVLIGRPNVGKSSIMNRLLGEERAIVTPIPGTTRDTLSEAILLQGHLIHIVDTAGFHETTDPVECEGIRRGEEALKRADLVLLILDATQPWEPDDVALQERIGHQKKVILANKSDLPIVLAPDAIATHYPDAPILFCSAKTGERFSELRHLLVSRLVPQEETDTERHPRVARLRHKNHLDVALSGLDRAFHAASAHASVEFIAADIRMALNALGDIIGETPTDAILDHIFSQFCIGK